MFLAFICGAGMPGKHWIHYILHRMTGRMFFWTDTGKWVKKKLNLNVYFLWMPVSRLADPCFPVYLVLWSTEVCIREFILTSSCCWGHRSDFSSWAGHPENEEHKSLARWEHFSLWLWNSSEKEKCSRCRNRTQLSWATFKRLHCKTTVIFLQLPAPFIIHFPILTNKQSGNPIGKSLLYFMLSIHPSNILHLCVVN